MRTHRFYTFTLVTIAGVWLAAAGTYAAPKADRTSATALAPVSAHAVATAVQSEGAQMKNPVAADATSAAAGKKIYDQFCVECHGEAGKGDGPRAPYTDPTPPSLVDAEWAQGSTDGDIFTVIQKGVTGTDMPSFAKEIPERQAWDVVNYVRSLAAPE